MFVTYFKKEDLEKAGANPKLTTEKFTEIDLDK
jgi:hypothetical protein